MKTTMKILPLLFGVMLFFTQCEKEAADMGNTIPEGTMVLKISDLACNDVQPLYAGAGRNILENGVLVGSVKWGIDDNTLYVKYVIDKQGWSLTETHLWVGDDIDDIPRNAAPGRFNDSKYHEEYADKHSYRYEIDISDFSDGPLYLAAHAVVGSGDGVYALLLPETIDFRVRFFNRFTDPLAYFQTTITDEPLADIYEGWCLDSYTRIKTDTDLEGSIYSSYGDHDDIFDGLFAMPENLPLVNWIINYDFVGKESPGEYEDDNGNTLYTLGDVQQAIWILLEETPNPNPAGGVGPFSNDRVDEIVEKAYKYGKGYVPGCGDDVVIIIVVPGQQTTMFRYPVPCGYDETAWAYGGDENTFIERGIANKWGWIFETTCP